MNLLTWEALSAMIASMPAELRRLPVISQDDGTGEYFGFIGVGYTDSEDNPPDWPMLEQSNDPLEQP